MAKILIIIALVLIFFGIGAWFVSYGVPTSQQTSTTPYPVQQTNEAAPTQQTVTETAKPLTGTDAIKAYAAMQFSIPVENLQVVSSKHVVWKDTCFDLPLDPKTCDKKDTSGYEMTFTIKGENVTYRGNEDGSIIRFVKQ